MRTFRGEEQVVVSSSVIRLPWSWWNSLLLLTSTSPVEVSEGEEDRKRGDVKGHQLYERSTRWRVFWRLWELLKLHSIGSARIRNRPILTAQYSYWRCEVAQRRHSAHWFFLRKLLCHPELRHSKHVALMVVTSASPPRPLSMILFM